MTEINHQLMIDDLNKSGLEVSDMGVRWIENPERAMTNTSFSIQGYVIPYYNLYGRSIPFYRVKLFDSDPKYKQPKETSNYIYFPKGFKELADKSKFIIFTEGEKKAAAAVKLGFPACSLGGVDSWKDRSIFLPKEAELSAKKDKIRAKLPSQSEAIEDINSPLAIGMQELIDYLIQNDKNLIIVYDSDNEVGIKASVQRAAASLGFELRFRGVPFNRIRQIVLPPISQKPGEKNGLDDFLKYSGKNKFQEMIDVCLKKRSAFPRHPTIRDFINKRLQAIHLSRKDIQALSIGILSDLDANGIRLNSTNEGQTYYFDFLTRKLIKTTFDASFDDVAGTPFGQFLYKRYGLSAADKRLIVWLSAQFTGEDPVEEVTPHRIIARVRPSDDAVFYQVSDSQYVGVSAEGIELYDNGENGILFESGQVDPIDTEKLLMMFEEQSKKPLKNLWSKVMGEVRLRDQEQQKKITSLLYYISPFLYRWRGTQLPLEMIIGESGSGKSTLCELRLKILEGKSHLRNAPQDLKDWHASVANTGGLHITDNVQLVDRNLRQRLSDEICRIITEPSPHIEMRRYYTNADLMRIPVNSVFALTAIQQPFQNADLLQRALILEFDKTVSIGSEGIVYDAEWGNNQLKDYGGREGWIAHHLLVLHKFFQLVKKEWNYKYQAKHRLINFEQSMILMAKVFGEEYNWIPNYLSSSTDKTLSESDWTFEGIRVFCEQMAKHLEDKKFSSSTISDWATGQEDYEKCEVLISPRRLGRYLQMHKSIIATVCGLVVAGQSNNKQMFKIEKPRKEITK